VGRNGRIAWGAGVLGLLALLVATIPLSGGSLARAEAEAGRWAEDKALEVVVSGVRPEIVARDVTGEDYRRLLVRIQAGILSDDEATTVRIWRIDGNLLFSTAQRDDVAEVTIQGHPSIERAAGGEVVSVLSDDTSEVPGLRPPKQPLFQTFVPLQPSGAKSVMGVVEIDQPYSSIHDPALRLWRLLQLVLAVALAGVLLGFVQSVRQHAAAKARRAANPSAPGPGRETREDRKRERTRSLAARAWPRTRRAETADHAVPPGPSPDARATELRMEELDLKVRAAEAEREQQAGEVKRLRDVLEEKEAELAIARQGASPRAEAKRERKVLAEAHKRAAEAERKAAQAEKKSEDAAKRAMDASTRALEIEAQLRSSEETIGALRTELASRPHLAGGEEPAPAPRRRDATDRKAAAELKKAQAELKKAQAELSRAQVERDGLADERSRLEAEVERGRAEVERVEAERAGLEVALAQSKADLQAQIAAAESDTGAALLEERATAAEMQLADSEERVADAQGRLVRSEASLSEALEKLSELEQTRAALSSELAQVKGVPVDEVVPEADATEGDADEMRVPVGGGSDLEVRIQELERARREDIGRLQHAQESFANTQLELTNASRKLREAEARIRELESELEAGPSRATAAVAPPVDAWPEPASTPTASQTPDVAETVPAVDDWDWPEPVAAPVADAATSADPEPDWTPGPPDEDPSAVQDDEEAPAGLSLRERLARAAAARHRGALS
jgi:chromosome segregation ATPase